MAVTHSILIQERLDFKSRKVDITDGHTTNVSKVFEKATYQLGGKADEMMTNQVQGKSQYSI